MDEIIRGIPGKASCLPSSVLVVTFCVPLVKGDDEFVSGFRTGLNLVSRAAMPTTNWEACQQSVHIYHYSRERFLMSKTIDDLQMLLFLLISNSANGDSSGIDAIILTLLTTMSFDDDLHRLRPSNFYPPEGFYPTGCHGDFWDRNKERVCVSLRHRNEVMKRRDGKKKKPSPSPTSSSRC